MADERDFELLDDYLTNRMSEQDRSAFEQKLKADPDLQHEYALQKRLIQGIKNARISELKSMLNNVPVPPSGTGNALATKIILGTVATLIIAGAAYWFTRDDQSISTPTPQVTTTEDVPSAIKETEPITESAKEPSKASTNDQKVVDTDKNQTSAGTEHSKPSLAKRPDPLSAPAAKNSDRSDGATENGVAKATSSLTVETVGNSKEYTFHYQIQDSKLLLYGPFDNNYEVMELMIDGKRTAFLYFKNQYYMLQESVTRPMPLTAVTDQTLLKKLTDHQGSR